MNTKKKKGYVLAVVIILTLIMTIIVTTTFTIIMRYMFWAKEDAQKFNNSTISYDIGEEVNANAYV